MNRYETHVVNTASGMKVIITNKWSGETIACCRRDMEWINLGIPKEPTPTSRFGEPIEPTPTN